MGVCRRMDIIFGCGVFWSDTGHSLILPYIVTLKTRRERVYYLRYS